MAFFNTSNPALRPQTFTRTSDTGATMTLQGTVNKTGILLLLCTASAAWTWHLYSTEGSDAVKPWLWGGIIGGLIVSLIAIFVKRSTPVTGPLYAVLEGFALGGISSAMNTLVYHNIAIEAVAITFGALVVMLLLYSARILQATPMFVRGVLVATGAIACVYLVNMVMSMFGHPLSFLSFNNTSWLSVGISIFVVIIATLNLILNFAMIEQGARDGAPKYMEWYGAFGIMVTLVWLYIEVLNLLAKMQGNRR